MDMNEYRYGDPTNLKRFSFSRNAREKNPSTEEYQHMCLSEYLTQEKNNEAKIREKNLEGILNTTILDVSSLET